MRRRADGPGPAGGGRAAGPLERPRVYALLALLLAVCSVPATIIPAQASSATTRHADGWSVTRTSTGKTLSITPDTAATREQRAAFLEAETHVCDGTLPCLSLGDPVNTGHTKYMVGPGGFCPCYYVTVWSKTYKACYTYEVRSVELCMTGKMIYVPGYAACFTRCTITGLGGAHACGTVGTGSFGWSLEQIDCSDSYLSTHASVARNTVQMCFVKISVCDTNTYHVNGYPSGTITLYNGAGSD